MFQLILSYYFCKQEAGCRVKGIWNFGWFYFFSGCNFGVSAFSTVTAHCSTVYCSPCVKENNVNQLCNKSAKL